MMHTARMLAAPVRGRRRWGVRYPAQSSAELNLLQKSSIVASHETEAHRMCEYGSVIGETL
jgi:hypothetical protein